MVGEREIHCTPFVAPEVFCAITLDVYLYLPAGASVFGINNEPESKTPNLAHTKRRANMLLVRIHQQTKITKNSW